MIKNTRQGINLNDGLCITWSAAVTLIFALSMTFGVSAATLEKPVFHYAGVSYLGGKQYIEEAYPQALKLNDTEGGNRLNHRLLELTQTLSPKYFDLSFEKANQDKGQYKVVSLALDREYVSVEDLGAHTKITVEASGQLLFMDYQTLTLIASYPVDSQVSTTVDQYDESQLTGLIEQLYFFSDVGDANGNGLLEQAAIKLSNANPAEFADGARFQVTDVLLSDKANKLVDSESIFKQFLGQYFTSRLSYQYKLNVIPFVKGYAIGNVMVGRFSNGDVYNLTLPLPDYEFVLAVNDINKLEKGRVNIYGSELGIGFSQPELGRSYLNDYFYYVVQKLISKNQKTVDDWSAYEDAMIVLIDDIVDQLGNPDKKWIKDHSNDESVYKRFKKKAALFH